jgi:sorbose reductase
MRSWLDLPLSPSSPGAKDEQDLTSDDGRPKKDLRGKQILFISSISGLVAMSPQYQAAYNASKAGVTMLAKVCVGRVSVYAVDKGARGTDVGYEPIFLIELGSGMGSL